MKYMIDKEVKLFHNCVITNLLINICKYSTPEMVKYIIDIYVEKEYDLQCKDNNDWQPIHYICRNSTPEMIKYIIDIYIDKGYELLCKNNDGETALELISKNTHI